MERSRHQVRPPEEGGERKPEHGSWTRFFAIAGALALTAGLLLAIGSRYSPEIAWFARSFSEVGILSGTIIGSGVLCVLLSMLSYQVQRINGQMRSAEEAMHCTQALSLGMRQMVDRTTRLHVELGEMKECQRLQTRMAQDLLNGQAAAQQVDATYHLAASLDQLGRRFETRLQAQENTYESRFLDILGSISATQEQLSEALEESVRQIEPDDLLDSPPLSLPQGLEAEPSLPSHHAELDELEVFVELEEDSEVEQPQDSGEAPDVASFDWDQIQLPSEEETPQKSTDEDGLGLLDELDSEAETQAADGPQEIDIDALPPITPSEGEGPESEMFSDEALEEAWQAFKRRSTE